MVITAVRDPTRVIWRRCFAYGSGVLLAGLVLFTTVYASGDVSRVKSGCPSPIPKGQDCLEYRSTGYLMRGSVFIWFAVALIISVVILVVVPQAVVGCSLGKALFGIRVVRADGNPPGFLRSSIRVAAWPIDGLALLLPIGLWLAIITPGHRRIGDYLAGTYVVERSAVGQPVHIPPRRRPIGRRTRSR
jgi:uncharacterized RDD family membrane protein YckC